MPKGMWTPTWRDWAVFSALATTLISLRLFLIITNQWNAESGGDLPEALISGRAAFDVLNGSWRGWHAYLYNTGGHIGNEVAASAFALPVFWLLGPSLLALVAVPMLAATVTAALVFRLSRSREAALLATTYLVFMPVAVQSWQIYPYFSHGEAVTWFLFAMWILAPVFAGVPSSLARPFAAGLVIGLGIVLCDLELAAVPSIAMAWGISKAPRPSRAVWVAAVLGVMAGVLPYFAYVAVRPSSVSSFYRMLFENGGPPADYRAYLRPWSLPASMLWPFNLAGSTKIRLLVGLISAAGLVWWGRRLTRLRPAPVIELAVVGFIASVSLLNMLTRNTEEYYTYALAAPIAFVVGSALAGLLARWDSPRLRLTAICGVAALGFALAVPAVLSVALEDIDEGWRATRIARGYSFYSPGPYRVFSGYKTALGREVEMVASTTRFSDPVDEARPEKTIFIARGVRARHVLNAREDYYTYGADVTALGVVGLSVQAVHEVEPRFWPEAFGSMAVFAANDFLLTDLVAMFADGSIDRAVPDCCLGMFYSELGRKIHDQARDNRAVTAFLADLPTAKRAWVDRGAAESRYVDYRLSWRR